MKKVLVDKKFVEELCLKEGDEFVVEDNYLLTAYARDYFIQNRIKVRQQRGIDWSRTRPWQEGRGWKMEDNEELQPSLKERIVCILLEDYKVPREAAEVVADKILEKLKKVEK